MAYKRGFDIGEISLVVTRKYTPRTIRAHTFENRYKRGFVISMGYGAPTPPAPTVWIYTGNTWRPVSMLAIRTI